MVHWYIRPIFRVGGHLLPDFRKESTPGCFFGFPNSGYPDFQKSGYSDLQIFGFPAEPRHICTMWHMCVVHCHCRKEQSYGSWMPCPNLKLWHILLTGEVQRHWERIEKTRNRGTRDKMHQNHIDFRHLIWS